MGKKVMIHTLQSHKNAHTYLSSNIIFLHNKVNFLKGHHRYVQLLLRSLQHNPDSFPTTIDLLNI